MKKILLISMGFLLAACCHKKGCQGDDMPGIILKFNGPLSGMDERVMYYTIENGQRIDSFKPYIDIFFPSDVLMPFEDYGDERPFTRLYVVKHNERRGVKFDTISHVYCNFRMEEVKCNQCFPFGHDRQSVRRFDNFSFSCKGNTYSGRDTLYLD